MISLIKNKKLANVLTEFFYGYEYPIILALIAIASYCFNLSLVGFTIFAVCACVSLVLFKDLSSILPLVFLFIYCFNNEYAWGSWYFYTWGIILGVFFILHFVLNKIKTVYLGRLFLPLCLVLMAFLLGGVLSPYIYDYFDGILIILPCGIVILFEYFIFTNYTHIPKNRNVKKYFCFLLILSTFTALATMLFAQAKVLFVENFSYSPNIGWGNANEIGVLLLMSVACCCYVISTTKKVVRYFLLLCALCVFMLSTGSDACLAIMIITLPFIMVLTYIECENKRAFGFCVLITAIISFAFGLFILFKVDVSKFVDVSDSGRMLLYQRAIRLFKENPVFGVGVGYVDVELLHMDLNVIVQFNFHSVLLHVLATMGTFGFICYSILFVKRINVLTKHNTSFNLFMLVAFELFEMYSLISSVEFILFPLLCILTLMFIIVEQQNDNYDYGDELAHNFNSVQYLKKD